MTARLPIPGSDDGSWGNVLNDFLSVAHNSDGSLLGGALGSAGAELAANKGVPSGYPSLNGSGQIPTSQLASGTAGSSVYLRGDGTWATPAGGGSATLASDTDVSIGSPADKQVLAYDNASGKWKNQTALVTSIAGRTGAVTIAESDVANLTTDLAAKAADNTVVHKGDLLFNIVDYGATLGSADNATAINSALTAAATGGGVVYFPPGTWKTTGGHVVPINVSVQGAGKGVTTIEHKGVGTYCFFIGSNSGGANPPSYMGRVGNFALMGQSAGNGTGPFGQQIGIKVLNCVLFTLENIYLTLLYEGVLLDGGDEVALGAGTFAGDGYVANVTASNIFIFLHVYRWVTNTTYLFCYAYGNGPITTGSVGIWMDAKPATSTLINPSVEGFDTGYLISTTQDALTFINPRLENCNTYVSWQNNSSGHIIIGGQPVAGVWASGTSAGSNTQIATDGWFPAVTSLPTASSSYRHAIYRIDGGAGVADGIYICTKDASGNYAWHEITTGSGGAGTATGVPGPTDQGLKGWTYDPVSMGSSGTALTSQRIQYARVIIPANATVTGVAMQLVALAANAPNTSNTFFGLYNSAGTQVAVTADLSGSVDNNGTNTTGAKEFAFSSAYAATAGTYYVGFVQTSTGPMQLGRSPFGSSSAYNFGISAAPFRYNTGASGQTSLPGSVTLSALTSTNDAYWLALY